MINNTTRQAIETLAALNRREWLHAWLVRCASRRRVLR